MKAMVRPNKTRNKSLWGSEKLSVIALSLLTFTLTGCAPQTNMSTSPLRSLKTIAVKFSSDNQLGDSRKETHLSAARLSTVTIKYCPQIDYDLDLSKEKFFVYIPKNFRNDEVYGLVVYISPNDSITKTPSGWKEVLDQHRLLFLAPQSAGNRCGSYRRMGLAVLGALSIMKDYNIDARRVYAAGCSGGARSAGNLGFYQPDLFSGTIQSCGSDFYRPVRKKYRTSDVDSLGLPYGLTELSQFHLNEIKNNVKFVLITGEHDFRRGNVLDIYHYGFLQDGLKVRLFDVPDMGHQDVSGTTLSMAIDYIESR